MIGQVGENSKIIVVKEAVRVKVPGDMEFFSGITIGPAEKPVVIPPHYHNAFAIGKVVVNRNFYGLDHKDLGRQITAIVQVFEKNVGGGKKYTAIDFFKANGTRPVLELKIVEQEVGEAVPIIGTNKFVCFKPL